MTYFGLIIGIIAAAMLSFVGIALKKQTGYWMISGYNTMSEDDKENVDIEKLSSLIGNYLLIMAGMIFLIFLLFHLKQGIAGAVVLLFLFPLTMYVMIKGQKYDKNTLKPDGTMKTRSKVYIGAMAVSMVVVFVGVAALLYFSNKPPEYVIEADSFRIIGLYGGDVYFADVQSITLKDQMPPVIIRRNGSSLGNSLKGYFKLEDIDRAKLFVDASVSSYIFLETSSGLLILNTADVEKTKDLYNSLTTAWRASPTNY